MTHKVSVLTSQTTLTDQLIQFREIIVIYCENHTKHLSTVRLNAKFLNITAGGAYSYHRALMG